MNYVVCPPEQRDMDVSLDDVNAFHAPVYKSQIKNLLDQTEEMKDVSTNKSLSSPVKVKFNERLDSAIGSCEGVVNRRDSKYMNELKLELDEPDSANSSLRKQQKAACRISLGSFDESNIASPDYIKDRIYSVKKHLDEETKTYQHTHQDTREEQEIDRVDNYLSRLGNKV